MPVCGGFTPQMMMRSSGWQILDGEPAYERRVAAPDQLCSISGCRRWYAPPHNPTTWLWSSSTTTVFDEWFSYFTAGPLWRLEKEMASSILRPVLLWPRPRRGHTQSTRGRLTKLDGGLSRLHSDVAQRLPNLGR